MIPIYERVPKIDSLRTILLKAEKIDSVDILGVHGAHFPALLPSASGRVAPTLLCSRASEMVLLAVAVAPSGTFHNKMRFLAVSTLHVNQVPQIPVD